MSCAASSRRCSTGGPSPTGGHDTAIPELTLYRFSNPTEPAQVIQQPAVYIVVQGRKQVTVGDKTYIYDPSQYLAVSLELPAVGRVVEASPEKPYLCMTLSVDPRELAALIVETGLPAPRDDHDGRALYVSPLESPLLDGLLRLVRLLDTPQDIPVLAPLILRELHYRLLQGEQHGRLAEMAIGDGRLRRVSGAIDWIKEHFAEPLQIEALAKRVNMSPSALHSHFKAVAAMSPIQYQKRLRLQEARRLLLLGRDERRSGRLRGWIREPIAVQPRIRSPLRSATAARRRKSARRSLRDATNPGKTPNFPNANDLGRS